MESETGGGMELLERTPFSVLITEEKALFEVREKYAKKPAKERRKAADFEYHSDVAEYFFNNSLVSQGLGPFRESFWPAGVIPLAIDPLYPPALLTVGSIEYDCNRIDEAMKLFFTLFTVPQDEEDLHKIIDKAGDFLLDHDDIDNALKVYSAGEKAYPEQAVYFIGSAYCLGKMGRYDEAVEKDRQAVQLEPGNYKHLNDLGYALFEAGKSGEAEEILKKSVSLSPEEYTLSRNNLQYIQECRKAETG